MPGRRAEPRWLTRQMLDIIHDAQLREHGGASGVRDDRVIESGLARSRRKSAYAKSPDIATLAAAYGFGLARNHGYVDGNKRAAFMAIYVFLGLNDRDLDVPEPESVVTIGRMAAGRMSEVQLADWIRAHMK